MFWSILPTALFLLANAVGGISLAVASASAASLTLIVVRRRNHDPVGLFVPATLGYVLVRGLVAVLTQSEDVYFAFGLASNTLIALTVLGSAFTARPAGLMAMPLFVRYSTSTRQNPLYRRVAAQVTAAWAIAELTLTIVEATHLTSMTANEFVGFRTFVGWPAMFVVVFFLVFYVRLRLDLVERSTVAAVQ